MLRKSLHQHEGRKRFPYRDTRGNITIGVGRNLAAKGLSDKEVDFLLENDMDDAILDARSLLKCFDELTDIRKMVVVEMAFNLGRTAFAQFRGTLLAIEQGRYDDAARHMLNSRWATQVGNRAVRLAYSMRTDKL